MPDRYDELRKRLLVQRPVAQTEDPQIDYSQAVDDSGMPIEKAPVPIAPPVTPESRRALQDKQDMNRTLSNLIVAAGPSLLGFGRGTAAEQSSRFDQSNKYLQNIGTLEADKLKKLKEIKNESGQPEFIAESNAIGMEPYHVPKAGLSASALVKGVPHKLFNPLTGERAIVSVGADNLARKIGTTDTMDISNWIQDLGVGTATSTDVFGTKTQDQYEKGAVNLKKNVKSTQGLGSYMGGIPLEEAKSRLKESGKGKEKVAESLATVGELEASERALRSTNDPITFSIAVGQALRSVEKRLSEDEQKRFMGNDYRSVFQNAENYIQGKMGTIPPNIRSGVIEAIKYLKQKEQGKIKSNQKSYSSTEGLNKKGIETVKRTSGQNPDQKPESNDWKNSLLEMR